jgi:DNA-binding CsgD family transcriptional regulator/tetratricopeptide (TPR) repeat protein
MGSTRDDIQHLAQAVSSAGQEPEQALALARGVWTRSRSGPVRAEAARTEAVAQLMLGRYVEGTEALTRAIALCRGPQSLLRRGRCLNARSVAFSLLAREDEAANDLAEALQVARMLGQLELEGLVSLNAGVMAEQFGALTQAALCWEQALARLPDGAYKAAAAGNLGMLYAREGRWPLAQSMAQLAIGMAQAAGVRDTVCLARGALAWMHGAQGEPAQARRALEALVAQARDTDNEVCEIHLSCLLGEALVWQRDWTAALALGQALMARLDARHWDEPRRELLAWLRRAAEGAGDWAVLATASTAAQAWQARSMHIVTAPGFVRLLSLMQQHPPLNGQATVENTPAGGALPLKLLSEAERAAVRGVAQGWSNLQIAAALGKSENTVRNQLSSARAKLGLATRSQLAAACGRAFG